MDQLLPEAFKKYTTRMLAMYPVVDHCWSDVDGVSSLNIPAAMSDGFDISVELTAEGMVLYCGGLHEHFSLQGAVDDFANHMVGMLYDLLTPLMRLREYYAGGKPYKWVLEY